MWQQTSKRAAAEEVSGRCRNGKPGYQANANAMARNREVEEVEVVVGEQSP